MTATYFPADLAPRDWRQFGDRKLALALLASALCHALLIVLSPHMGWNTDLSILVGTNNETWPATPWIVSLPPTFTPPTIALPTPARPGVCAPHVGGQPSGGTPGPKPVGLVGVLENNRELIGILTAGVHGAAPPMSSDTGEFRTPRTGVRIASANDHASAPSAAPVGGDISVPGLSGPRGDTPIGERVKRAMTSTMSTPRTDSLDADSNSLVRQALLARLPAVKHCYERALNTNVSLEGKITAQATFDVSGNVQSAELLANGLADGNVGPCIVAELRKAKTAKPLGRSVTATVPYVFAAVN